MTMFWGLFFSALISASCPELSESVQQRVQHSTYKVVPRNFYASVISEQQARDLYQSKCHSTPLTISDQMNCDVLKTCTGEACKIEYMPFGSAFFIQGKSAIVTAWHVVFPTHAAPLYFMQNTLTKMSPSELNSHLSVLEPDFVLLDANHNVVYDSQAQPARYKFWGDPLSTIYQALGHRRETPYGYFENAPDDFVAIELSDFHPKSSLPMALTISNTDGTSQCLYAAGFQYHDGQFRFSSGLKKNIKSMQSQLSFITPFQLNPLPLSKDELLQKSLEEILTIMGYSQENIASTLQKYEPTVIWQSIDVLLHAQIRHLRDQTLEANPHLVFYDAPVLPGQSGGPIVNADGHVVGLTTNSFYDKGHHVDNHFASYGAVGLLLTALDSYW